MFTTTIQMDDAGDPEAITVPVPCRRVYIRENSGNAGWEFRAPAVNSTATLMSAGEAKEIIANFASFDAGQVIGYGNALAGGGTLTFKMECH